MNDFKHVEMVDRDMANVLRVKTERERLEIAEGMIRSARRMLVQMLRKDHPDWTDAQLNCEASRRLASGG